MAIPKPKLSRDNSEPPRGRPWLLVLLLAALAATVYWQIRTANESPADPQTTYDPSKSRTSVSCWTAAGCAAVMASDWQIQLPLDQDASVLESVTATGETLTFVRRLKYDRAFHEAAQYPDGKTWEQWQADFAAVACDEYDHRPLISLGGRVVHRTVFSDGELLSELVIDTCRL